MLEAFELHGKVILHKEALNASGVGEVLYLKSQARAYFSWISAKVVPCLMKKSEISCSPFVDLSLSGIDIDGSHVFDTTFETAERLSTSFNDITDTSTFISAFALSIIKVGMFLCSDFISIGGTGLEEISKYILEWMSVLSRSDKETRMHLLPCFCKLTAQLVSENKNCELLKQLLSSSIVLDSKSDCDVLIQKTILFILKANSSKHNSNLYANEAGDDLYLHLKLVSEAIISAKLSSLKAVESNGEQASSLEELFKDCKDTLSKAIVTYINFSLESRMTAVGFIVTTLNNIDVDDKEGIFLISLLFAIKNQFGFDDTMKDALLKIDRTRFERSSSMEEINKLIDL